MDGKMMRYRQKSLFWPNFDDSQPSIAKMARRITIFIRFHMFYFSFSIFHISSSNQDENNGVSYIQIGSQTKNDIFIQFTRDRRLQRGKRTNLPRPEI